jgi:hypothetical protein
MGDANGGLGSSANGVATLVDQNLLKPVEQTGGEAPLACWRRSEYGLEQLAASGEAGRFAHHADFFSLAEALPRVEEGAEA